jgi:hypothetical protein
MATYSLGHVQDPTHKRTQRAARELLGATPSLPDAASLEHLECDALNQGPTSSCPGHGTAACLVVSLAAAGDPLPWVPSPRGVYALTRQLARATTAPTGRALPALEDGGAMPSDVMDALRLYGVRAMRGPTSDGRNSDVEPANVLEEEQLAEVEADHGTILTGEYRVNETDADFIDQLCAALAGVGAGQGGRGCALGVGAYVDQAVMDWAKGAAPLSVPNLSDPRGGGHWFAVTSYRTAGGKRVFRSLNSWGRGYGDAGHWEFTEDWLRAQVPAGLDLYPMHARRTADAGRSR